MKKQMNTNKITKRALALVLTMSLVFGLAFTVYADEEDGASAAAETTEIASETSEPAPAADNNTSSEPASTSTPQEAAAAAAVETAGEATAAIQTAETAVDVIVIGSEIATELENADVLINGNEEGTVDGAVDNLEDAQTAMAEAVEGYEDKEALVDNLEKKNAEVKKAVDQANKNIDTANTTKSETKAVKAAAAAEKDVEAAKTALAEAEKQVEEIQKKWNDANTKQVEAQKAADDALANAKENTGAALAALNAARARMEALDSQKEALEALEEQYRETMIHYYRDTKEINSAVYNNGKIDLEASARKAYENHKVDDHPELTENTMRMCRELMRQLIVYKLRANGAVGEIHFAEKENGMTVNKNRKYAAEGKIVKDNNGNEKVNLESSYEQWWYPGSGDNHRNNRVKVTYTVKYMENGEEKTKDITEYYNYVFKNAQYDEALTSYAEAEKKGEEAAKAASEQGTAEMMKGPIYLALVQDEGEGWKAAKDTNAYNLDDYQELKKALEATDKYDAAKAALEAAEKKVQELKNEVEALENVKFDDSELRALEARLNEAIKNKEDLEKEVKKAEEDLEKIDLSRFEVVPADDDSDDTSSRTTTPVIASITPAVTVTPVLPEIVPVATIGAAPAIANLVAVADDGAEAAPEAVAEAPVTLEDEVLPAAAEAPEEKLTNIADEEVPAAQAVEEGISLWWLWILLLIALIVAYCVYKYNEKKKENENKAA